MTKLCQSEIERKTIGQERLSPHQEIEDEAQSIISQMSLAELKALEQQVSTQLQTNPAYAKEFQYWNTLKHKAGEQALKLQVERVYEQCCVDQADLIREKKAELA